MMNENSPICAMLIPARTDIATPLPEGTPRPTRRPACRRHHDGGQRQRRPPSARATRRGSMSIPTDTKNTAAKTSRTGSTSRSMLWARPDSATSAPPEECAQRDRVAERPRQQRAPEADPDAGHDAWSRGCRAGDGANGAGDEQHPNTSMPTRNAASLPTVRASAPADSRHHWPAPSAQRAAGSRSGLRRSGSRRRAR